MLFHLHEQLTKDVDSVFLPSSECRGAQRIFVRLLAIVEYADTLVRWLKAGAPKDAGEVPKVVSVEIYPEEAVLDGEGATQQINVRAAGKWNVHLAADIPDGRHHLNNDVHFLLGLSIDVVRIGARVRGNHDALPGVREPLPELFGNKRHKRVQQLKCRSEYPDHNLLGKVAPLPVILLVQLGFGQLEIPVTIFVPYELI